MVDWKIPLFKTYSDQDDIDAVTKIIKRGTYWADGPEIRKFEDEVAEFSGVKYCLAFNSGTSALYTLLLTYDIKNKEVIVPSFTFIATVNAVVLAGGIPVFAETESETFGLDVEDVKKKITKNTAIIIALHYAGFPSRDIKKLKEICEEKRIFLIEDAAESMGANINGKNVGTFGHSSIFSLCQNKIISTGEGGLIITDSQEVYEKAKLLRSHGRVEELEDYFNSTGDNDYINVGNNFRMSTISAGLGISQLNKIKKLISMRRENADYLTQQLSKITGINFPKRIEGHFQVYQMYPILLEDEEIRNDLQQFLTRKSIMSKVYFKPVHLKTIYKRDYNYKEEDLPKTEALSQKILSLPFYPDMNKDEMDYLVESIKEFFKEKSLSSFSIREERTKFQNLNISHDPFKDKIILVTGGCGSIGSEIVRQLLKHNPRSIRVFDNRESELFYMQNELIEHKNVAFLVGDVRDRKRLEIAMENVDIVFHAAALKHIPSCEYNPFEAVKTNVNGTNNVIEAAFSQNVEKVINISTDKVTNTINTLGSTKLLAERLIISAQYWKGKKRTIFSSVRFGNVVGSNGSVIDLFKKQISKGGPITITNLEMTRFIMSVKQAVNLVLETVDEMVGGETFILKMPVFKLQDLADVTIEYLAPKYMYAVEDIKKEIIGMRPGEKMYEDLMTEEESNKVIETENKFIILPQVKIVNWEGEKIYNNDRIKIIKKRYSSRDIAPLTKEELKELIKKEKILD